MILQAAGSDAELVRVPDDPLPPDLEETGNVLQHIVCTSHKARTMLYWGTSDPYETLQAAVRWHLAHPPPEAGTDFSADDRALGTV